MSKKHLVLSTVAVMAVITAFAMTPVAYTHDDDRPPSGSQIASAQQVSDLMLNELLAALFQEFKETTPQNVEHGKRAISLVFNDHNRDMRLVGAFRPLLGGENNRAGDRF